MKIMKILVKKISKSSKKSINKLIIKYKLAIVNIQNVYDFIVLVFNQMVNVVLSVLALIVLTMINMII